MQRKTPGPYRVHIIYGFRHPLGVLEHMPRRQGETTVDTTSLSEPVTAGSRSPTGL